MKCCVIDWHVLFICYNTSGYKTSHRIHPPSLRPKEKWPVSVSSSDLCQNQVPAHHFNIYLYRYNVNAFGRHPVHWRLLTQLSMLFRTSLNKSPCNIKIAAKFYFPARSTVLEQRLGSTMMKCRLHWYIALAQARRRAELTLPLFINRMAMYQGKCSLVSPRLREGTFLSTSVPDKHAGLNLTPLNAAKKVPWRDIKTEITLWTKEIFVINLSGKISWHSSLS